MNRDGVKFRVDHQGRATLPAEVLAWLGVGAADTVVAELLPDHRVTLTPLPQPAVHTPSNHGTLLRQAGADASPIDRYGTEPFSVAGIDVSSRRIAWAQLDGSAELLDFGDPPFAEGWERCLEPARIVAVDAPSHLCAGHRPGRLCEREVTQLLRQAFAGSGDAVQVGAIRTPPVLDDAMSSVRVFLRAGLTVYDRLEAGGWTHVTDAACLGGTPRAVIEVYPDAAFWLLGRAAQGAGFRLLRKRQKGVSKEQLCADRMRVLGWTPVRITGDALARLRSVPASRRLDILDAVCAALVAWLSSRGLVVFTAAGNADGSIVLPAQ